MSCITITTQQLNIFCRPMCDLVLKGYTAQNRLV
uniref:Uncharacterized protein n=1 Tax=Anguilla anguilla TaxID=7936 RepID=A0A0E9TLT7_ANGAN